MSRRLKLMIGFGVLLFGLVIYLQSIQKDKVDWTPSFSIQDKIPMGTYVFYHSLSQVVNELHLVKETPFEFFADTTKTNQVYMAVHREFPSNRSAQDALLNWVSVGNTAFISASFSPLFNSDSLGLSRRFKRLRNKVYTYPAYNLVNPALKANQSWVFDHPWKLSFFSKLDTLRYRVLGVGQIKTDSSKTGQKEVNFIEIPYGKGKLLLHTSPEVFSNYFMLTHQNYRYAEAALSYINTSQPVYYDVYYDPEYQDYHSSPLYVLLDNTYLKWGYYFLLIGAVLFVVFEGKRRQKSIEVIPPIRNKSYDYVRTISGLYLQKKDHTAIAHKVIAQFIAELQQSWHMEIKIIDDKLINRLTELTHYPAEDIRKLFNEINRLQNKTIITKKELLRLNALITNFKHYNHD